MDNFNSVRQEYFISQSPSSQSVPTPTNGIDPYILNRLGLLGVILAISGFLYLKGLGANKGEIAQARFCNRFDKLNAVRMAFRCFEATKAGKPYPSALWCGTPQYKYNYGFLSDKWKAFLQVILHNTLPTLYLPDIGRGWLVVGGPGSGKTYSKPYTLHCSRIWL